MYLNELEWGADTAENDSHLLDYFLESEAFKRLEKMQKNIVVGRKGSGKSALLKKLKEKLETLDDTITVKITPDLETLRSIIEDERLANNYGKEIFFQHAWLRQIMLSFLCVFGHDVKGRFIKGSKEYARSIAKENGTTSIDFVETVYKVLTSLEINIGGDKSYGVRMKTELAKSSDVNALQHHLSELAEEGYKFVAVIDDLDLGWDNSPTANNLLLGLLNAANYLESLHKNICPIVFLREDIYEIILKNTQQSDKFRNIERIRWGEEQLVSILEKRICFNYKKHEMIEPEDPFNFVFPQTIGTSNTKNWVLERTLSRPRELIQLARSYTEGLNSEKPSSEKLKSSESEYSNWKLHDLCTEYQNQYPGLKTILDYWAAKFFRKKYHMNRDEIEELIFEILLELDLQESWFLDIQSSGNFVRFLNILYEVGFVGDFVRGGQGGSRTYYSFEGNHEPIFNEVQIHPCFRKAVNTVERIRS